MRTTAQAKGPLTIDTPLEKGVLQIRSVTGQESISAPFSYELELVSEDASLKLSDLLGQPVTVHLELPNDEFRHFNGIVTHFAAVDRDGEVSKYRATMTCWLAMLDLRTNCRVFQHKNIPSIVKEIFREHGFSDLKEQLVEDYPILDYVVQYRESDFAFVSRLLERAGVHYFFTHEETTHTLVLADSQAAHNKMPGCETLPYYPFSEHRKRVKQSVYHWRVARHVQAGAVATSDYNFRTSLANLLSRKASPEDHGMADFEAFDYPGGYRDREDGQRVVDLQIERIRAVHAQTVGECNVREMKVGAVFSLSEHPQSSYNREYLITSTSIRMQGHDIGSGTGDELPVFECEFSVLDTERPYRPQQKTPKPAMRGPQTAVVVSTANEAILTEPFGCVKVQFHWDRYGQMDENSSCWIRVSQAWAGSGWGAIHIPRVGQEVIVDFLEGDPDRPIIVGRVYNDMNMPPYELPKDRTQSGIKSRSMNNGGPNNFNEIRFEDKKGQEDLFIHAEKTQTTKVKASQSVSVGGSQSVSVGGAQSVSVGGTRSVTVSGGDGKGEFQSTMNVMGSHQLHTSKSISIDAPIAVKAFSKTSFLEITPASIVLQCGGSKIEMTDGIITLCSGNNARVALSDTVFIASAKDAQVTLSDAATMSAPGGGSIQIKDDIEAQSKEGASKLTLKGAAELTSGLVTIAGADATKITGGGGTVEASNGMVKINS